MSAPADRARYIDGLRVLASVLEQNPNLPLPLTGADGDPFRWLFLNPRGDARAEMAAVARAVPCAWRKESSEADPGGKWPAYFYLRGQLAGLHLKMTAQRDAVCTKVVRGTRKVTEEVPDPKALAKVPKVKVIRIVEDVEWRCGSILSPVEDRQPAALAAGGES